MYPNSGGRRGVTPVRLILALVIALISVGSYYFSTQKNEITGETQRVNLTKDEEIALGLQSAPQMIQQYGGESANPKETALVREIGNRLVERTAARTSGYRFEFHVLADPNTINAFALPGGQVFITQALLRRLRTRGELAGVLGHEIGHVIARHGAEHLAKQKLTGGLVGAVAVGSDSQMATQAAQAIAATVNMKYGRDDELESDALGVRLMSEAGFDPRAMIGVMEVLAEASKGANRQPEFFSTHPNPENRIAKLQALIQETYPSGLPKGLEK
jgi:predicted Zn-dependent protease